MLLIIKNRKLHIIMAYLMIYLVWGSTYYFIGEALKSFPPFLLGAIRFCSAGVFLLIWCMVKKVPIFHRQLIRRSAVSGVVLLFIDMAVVMLAQQYLPSSLVAILASSTALWIVLLDLPLWRENFRDLFKISGLCLGFLGVGMLYFEQYFKEDPYLKGENGIYLLVFGCISWALGTLYTKRFFSRNSNALAGAGWQMFFASAAFWTAALMREESALVCWRAIPAASWFSLGYLIFFGSILAYSAYIWLLRIRPAAEVGTHAYVNPVIAMLLGVWAGKENISWIQICGLCIILLGVCMATRKSSRAEERP